VSDAMLKHAHLLHIGYPPLLLRLALHNGRDARRIFERAKQHNLTTSLDMSLPDVNTRQGQVDWSRWLQNVLPAVDVFLPSWEEAVRMTRGKYTCLHGDRLAQVAEWLLASGTAVVGIKLGDQGLYIRTSPDRERIRALGACAPIQLDNWVNRELLVPCYRVPIAGTTGAGDTTFAGFLYGLLNGCTLERTMTLSVALGSFCVETLDAVGGLPNKTELYQRVQSNPARLPVRMPLPGWCWYQSNQVWIKGEQ
ncbi:MAG: carbohydrate kinase family protein, partial [Kiritimatiellae bacterium]|nr:carbohydrate kinase family protein [Kiritimatiellia bacterium]